MVPKITERIQGKNKFNEQKKTEKGKAKSSRILALFLAVKNIL